MVKSKSDRLLRYRRRKKRHDNVRWDSRCFGVWSAAIAFVAGVVAIGLTLGSAVLALTGLAAASTLLTIGAIGTIAGQFALYTGIFAMGASGAQYVSGSLGYRLNGEKLSEEEAKDRIRKGETNLMLSYTGLMTGGIASIIGGPVVITNAHREYVKEATQNPSSNTVVLGKMNQDGISYADVAENNKATYFQLKEEIWNEASKKLGEENMWDINELFLEQQYSQGKTFILSHDPYSATGYFLKEVQWLIYKGFHFIKEVDSNGLTMWRAIR